MAKVYFSKEDFTVEVDEEISVLTLALNHDIKMTHRCGAEVRCSTCKFRILEGAEAFSEKSMAEQRLLEKFRYPEFIRLGCQAKINPDFDGIIEVGTIIKTFNKQSKGPRVPAKFMKK